MTATSTATPAREVSRNCTSGLSTSCRTPNVWRASKLGTKTRPTTWSNIFRWYRSSFGRYTTPDPLGLSGGDDNPYHYALLNPLRFQDSLGLRATPVPKPPTPKPWPQVCPKATPPVPGPPLLSAFLMGVAIFFTATPLNQGEFDSPPYCGCDNDPVEQCKKACVKAWEIRYDECSERFSGNPAKQALCYERIARDLGDCLKDC